MNIWLKRALWTLLIAIIVHLAAVYAVPRVIMGLTINRYATLAKLNTPLRPPLPDARARRIVQPSPDLLYVACAYDLAEGPLLVTGEIPDTYWSVSFFAANSDNFFVLNDRQAKEKRVRIVLAIDGGSPADGAQTVISPSRRGVVLFRTLVLDLADLPMLQRFQQTMSCETLSH